jgi:hypothetical protein
MLRASIEFSGADAGLGGITEGAKAGDSGIEHGVLLTTFADAAVKGDSAELTTARDALREAAGSSLLVDAAAVVGNFERMVRIADGTGIPLDGIVVALSNDFREELGLEEFESRRVKPSGPIARVLAPVLRRAAGIALRFAGRRGAAKQS